MSNRETEIEHDGAEEVHDIPTRASVSTPPSFTFPTSTPSVPYTQLKGCQMQQYPSQEKRFGQATMSADAPRLPTSPGLEDVPIIDENVELNDLSESQLIDYVRQAKDTYSRYFPEGHVPLVQTDHAMILLAKNVTEEVFERRFVPIKARYLLNQNMDLYIPRFQVIVMAFSVRESLLIALI
jgi:hypothetical protein